MTANRVCGGGGHVDGAWEGEGAVAAPVDFAEEVADGEERAGAVCTDEPEDGTVALGGGVDAVAFGLGGGAIATESAGRLLGPASLLVAGTQDDEGSGGGPSVCLGQVAAAALFDFFDEYAGGGGFCGGKIAAADDEHGIGQVDGLGLGGNWAGEAQEDKEADASLLKRGEMDEKRHAVAPNAAAVCGFDLVGTGYRCGGVEYAGRGRMVASGGPGRWDGGFLVEGSRGMMTGGVVDYEAVSVNYIFSQVNRFTVVCALVALGTLYGGQGFAHEPIAVLELADTPAVRLELIAGGYEVDTCDRSRLRIYAREGDLKRLESRKIAYTVVGQLPDPPSFSKTFPTLGEYHSYDQMTARLESYAENFPDLARLSSVGKSAQGRDLWVLKITENPDVRQARPQFKYVATMHGDEVMGTELCLYFIDTLLNKYGDNDSEGQRVTWLVDNTEIWIMPLMNPDGFVLGSRFNANGVDLNRNFPSYVLENADGNIFDGDSLRAVGRQPETRAVMEWSAGESFNASANYHGGALVVNYPFDEGDAPQHTYAASPDDVLFIDISKRYSQSNGPMWNSPIFPMGITNGSDWYTIYGGMQDWHYRYLSCNEVLIEVSAPKRPAQSTIPTYWSQNKESMFAYLESVHMGVRGVVSNVVTGEPVYARVEVTSIGHPVYTDPRVGNYHRMLTPGNYTLAISAPGYFSTSIADVTVTAGLATVVDVALLPLNVEEGEGVPEGEGTVEGEGDATIWHSADTNQNGMISLGELLRLIQFFNSDGFHCDASTEDGYAPDGGVRTCLPHDSDYNPQDWRVQLTELLRLIQFFNSLGYSACPEGTTEDGFCVHF